MLSKTNLLTLIRSEAFSGILMLCSFALALLAANIHHLATPYTELVYYSLDLKWGGFSYHSSLLNFINDGLMTFFFLMIGMELKYHLILGEYVDRKILLLPTASAIGGVIFPALIYIFFNTGKSTLAGWAIPVASDTAFILAFLSFFHNRVSLKLRAFILSFSLIDDALALLILTLFYSQSLNLTSFLFSLLFFSGLLILNHLNVKNMIYYLIVGAFLWMAMRQCGIHGTLSGAILAMTLPVHIKGEKNLSFQKLENYLRPIVQYCILPAFIFVNAGVTLEDFTFESTCSSISWGIILGLFLGKQLGISSFAYLVIKSGHGTLPYHTSWLTFYATAILGGIGFTLSLFIGELTFESGCAYYAMRSGVIIGSLLSASVGILVFIYSLKHSIYSKQSP